MPISNRRTSDQSRRAQRNGTQTYPRPEGPRPAQALQGARVRVWARPPQPSRGREGRERETHAPRVEPLGPRWQPAQEAPPRQERGVRTRRAGPRAKGRAGQPRVLELEELRSRERVSDRYTGALGCCKTNPRPERATRAREEQLSRRGSRPVSKSALVDWSNK